MPLWLGLDEIHILGQPRAVIANVQARCMIDMLVSRNKPTIARYVSALPDRQTVEVICMDMWRPYQEVAAALLPVRATAKCHDRSVCTGTPHDGLRTSDAEVRSMELVIPEGAQVHITVGSPPWLALPGAVVSPPQRPGGRIALGLLAGVLLIGAFQAGRLLPRHAEAASAGEASAALADHPGLAGGSAAGEIPAAFRARLAQPPQVIPPPGAALVVPRSAPAGGAAAPASPPASANPFGLQG